MDQEINPELVINDLLDKNRQLTLEVSILRAAYKQLQDSMPVQERPAEKPKK